MRKNMVSGLLFLCIGGVLLAYFITVNNLPVHLFTAAQQEYIRANNSRSLVQNALTLNLMKMSPLDCLAPYSCGQVDLFHP